MKSNPFTALDKVKEQLDIDAAWDKELETIKENRNRFSLFKREKEIAAVAERKRKSSCE